MSQSGVRWTTTVSLQAQLPPLFASYALCVCTRHSAWVDKGVNEHYAVEVFTRSSVLCNENRILQHNPSGSRYHTQAAFNSRQWRE